MHHCSRQHLTTLIKVLELVLSRPLPHKRMEREPSGDEFYKGRLPSSSSLSFPQKTIFRDCLFDWWNNSMHWWILSSYENTWDVLVVVRSTEPELVTYSQRNNKCFSGSPHTPHPTAHTHSTGNIS